MGTTWTMKPVVIFVLGNGVPPRQVLLFVKAVRMVRMTTREMMARAMISINQRTKATRIIREVVVIVTKRVIIIGMGRGVGGNSWVPATTRGGGRRLSKEDPGIGDGISA